MQTERPAHVLPVPQWTLAIHAVQVLLSIIILGLNAYGIRWIAYNVLIYSLVVVSVNEHWLRGASLIMTVPLYFGCMRLYDCLDLGHTQKL
jgi:hypothetical protein